MISVHNLQKIYTMGAVEVPALNGVSFAIEAGEFVGITGSSGSGKSTLLHLVGLLDRPTAGTVTIDGIDVLQLPDDRRTRFRLTRLGYVFQDYALVPDLTALENVYLPSLARGGDNGAIVRKAGGILEAVGLGDRTGHLPKELSGGEQQRVAIARSLINDPGILLADEPCANLDSTNSKTVLELFRTINRESGRTILMVSHEEWHLPYFDRVIRLRDGRIDVDEHRTGGDGRRD
jgi:putative ABC transport system ATP-binding protein